VAAILSISENAEGEGQDLTEAEKKSLFQMSIEEVSGIKSFGREYLNLINV